ncbi:hypothetical protein WMY93_006112 [Mugilogobius chulae]|uniref:Myosin motor domain-containing protein n=1 Tax=Mugilogobius chulae TaxID=88201 RepID=A0AAW0PSK6_9GOBI
MALSSRLKLWEQKGGPQLQHVVLTQHGLTHYSVYVCVLLKACASVSSSRGFLKQLVRDSEKETKLKEPESKTDDKAPSKLSNNLVQQFLIPDQTPPILEAEMSLKTEQLSDEKQWNHSSQSENQSTSPRQLIDSVQVIRQEMISAQPKVKQGMMSGVKKENKERKERIEVELPRKVDGIETRQEPEGKQADSTIVELQRNEVKDVWYEAGTVWYLHKDGYSLATQLKPDEGTPELPDGKVRVRLQTDGTLHDVPEFDIEKSNPKELDLCEDLSNLQSVNECGVLHTLISRAKANMPLTHADPKVATWRVCVGCPSCSGRSGQTGVCVHVGTRRDHSVCALGRSGTGKTTACQAFTLALLRQAGTAGNNISFDKVKAMFTVLRSFGCVASHHSDASTRFAMVFSLDFNHAGQAAAGHLQTMMLDKWKVCQKTPGESNFLVFGQMLAGLSTEMRTELQLHQLSETNSFGIVHPTKVEEKQRASVAFTKLLSAMETLGFSLSEQKAIWHVLAGIYHLGAAGASKVGRRQFGNFDSSQVASSHHLRQLLQRATGGARERTSPVDSDEGPRLTATQCLDGMAAGLYEELFTALVSLVNSFIPVLLSPGLMQPAADTCLGDHTDTPGTRNPRHCGDERGASWSELCHNYLQERLLEHYHTYTFKHESIPVQFECPENSPSELVSAIDQPPPQIRAADADPRGLLWVLDEEMVTLLPVRATPWRESAYSTVRQCEQPLQCEINHLMSGDPIRYDMTGWFGLIQNNPSASNAICLLQNSTILSEGLVHPKISLPPLCRGLGGLEGSSQRSLQRNGTIRKTFSGEWQLFDALLNVIRRARPVFLQCVSAKSEGGSFDVPALRVQLHSTQILSALQLYRTGNTFILLMSRCFPGYPEHMPLSDFRCHFQALSPPIMKRYASMFVMHDERKVRNKGYVKCKKVYIKFGLQVKICSFSQAVEELLVELDLDRKSIVLGASRIFMKRGVLRYLEHQRDQQVTGWLVHLQAACLGHLARQRYRKLKSLKDGVQMALVELFCRIRPMLDVNMDNERLRAKEDEILSMRRRLEKSEKERNELRQSTYSLETKVTAVTSELSDERFRGDALRVEQCKVTMETLEKQLEEEKQKSTIAQSQRGAGTSELAMQLECCQTEVEFLSRRLKQTEEKLETEKQTRQQLDAKVATLQAQLEQSRRSVTELKRHCRRVTSDLQDARVLTDTLQSRMHELERKQKKFDNELTQALEEAENERELKDKAFMKTQVGRLQKQKDELCAQIRDLSLPVDLASESLPDLKKQLRLLESQAGEQTEEITKLTAKLQQQQQCEEESSVKQIHQRSFTVLYSILRL